MNKQIINLVMIVALVMPSALFAFELKQDGIMLKVVDYAERTESALGYTQDGPLTGDKFMAKGIHPVRVTITNNSDKPVMISGRSVRLKMISQEDLIDMFKKDRLWTSSEATDAVVYWGLWMAFDYAIFQRFTAFLTICNTFLAAHKYEVWTKNNGILSKALKDLAAQEELRYPETIQPGKKRSKLFLIDERVRKNRMIEFVVLDSKHEEVVTTFDIELI